MKFSTTESFARLQNVASGEEGLIDAISQCADASASALEHIAAGEEVCQVIDNLACAVEAIQTYGLTEQTVAVFNSQGELSACIGEENLTVEGLESFGEAQIKSLSKKYSAGLEGKVAEYWNKFVEWLKQMWAKFVNWIKALFIKRAKWTKLLQDLKGAEKGHVWDGSLELECLSEAQLVKVWNQYVEADKALVDIAAKSTFAVKDAKEGTLDLTEKGGSLEKKGWTQAKWEKWRKDFIEQIGKSKNVPKAQKKIDEVFKWCIDEAKKTGNYEGKKLEDARKEIQEQRELAIRGMQIIRTEDKLAAKIASTLYKIGKKGFSQGK